VSSHRPVINVYWRIGEMHYPMMHVLPAQIKRIRKKSPDLMSIPTMFALTDDGDIEWFPDCMEGEPVVSMLAI
jgi:hypothetical protein